MVRGGLLKHAVFNKSLLEFIACPLSKEPLRYCEKSQELVNDAFGVAYPIVNGVPCLVPTRGRILDNSKDNNSDSSPCDAKRPPFGSLGELKRHAHDHERVRRKAEHLGYYDALTRARLPRYKTQSSSSSGSGSDKSN